MNCSIHSKVTWTCHLFTWLIYVRQIWTYFCFIFVYIHSSRSLFCRLIQVIVSSINIALQLARIEQPNKTKSSCSSLMCFGFCFASVSMTASCRLPKLSSKAGSNQKKQSNYAALARFEAIWSFASNRVEASMQSLSIFLKIDSKPEWFVHRDTPIRLL